MQRARLKMRARDIIIHGKISPGRGVFCLDTRKVAFVTGAARNTGFAIARRFASEGYGVCISSRSEPQLRQAEGLLRAECPQAACLGVVMDPSDVGSIRQAFEQIGLRFGRLDAFVSNAANLAVGMNVFNTSPEDWDAVMDANARGTFFCCQEAVKLMRKAGGGSICSVSSVHANQAIPGRVCYSASKAAVNAMMRCLAVELGHLNIRANSVIAGAIHTERWDGQSAEETKRRRGQYPAGRESTPEEIAGCVYFLCSDQSPTVTGTEMTVDSGISVCLLPYNKEWNSR